MDAEFWHRKWREREIGFHAPKPNALLGRHIRHIAGRGQRVFLPLCGKTLDIHWLLEQGYRVVGVELHRQAVMELFEELGLEPQVTPAGALELFQPREKRLRGSLDIFVGDLFDLDRAQLGPVDAIYDRAALVALPEGTRPRYAAHLAGISERAPQLVIAFEYDPEAFSGPPFSISPEELERIYGADYRIQLAESRPLPGGLKGLPAVTESAWFLQALE